MTDNSDNHNLDWDSFNWDNLDWDRILAPLAELKDCAICPRECHADRESSKLGYCQSSTGYSVSSVFAHKGEEPVLSGENGICNIFFTRCNMQCVYCQNYQISRNHDPKTKNLIELNDLIGQIETLLDQGAHGVGFVSPSHFVPQMKVIINVLRARGRNPVFVYNSNGYDRVETLQSLEGMIDVYLPDLKYADNDLARQLSDTPKYVESSQAALREMYRQVGDRLSLNHEGLAVSGLIVRHLVLPGQIENSKRLLGFIANELSSSVWVSLMAQYYPTEHVRDMPSMNRTLTKAEYDQVLDEFDRLGFANGFVQELESANNYLPDFDSQRPFED